MASGKCTYLREALLDHALGRTIWTPPGILYLALSLAAFDNTSTGASIGAHEVAGGGYVRLQVNNTTSVWSTTASDGTKHNLITLNMANATAAWGNVLSFYLLDGNAMSAADNCLFGGDLTNAVTVPEGPGPQFAVGDLMIKES